MNNMEYATKFASRSFVLAVLAYASLAGAAPPERAADLRAAGVQMGPAVLYPSLGLHFGRDDNIFLQPSGEKSSNIIVLIPTLDFVAVNNGQRYGLLYQAEAGRYGDSSADDYTDQRLLAEADVGLGQRGRLDLQAEYLDEHDPRGTGASEGNPLLSDNPDVWHSTRLGATFKYGAPGARGRLDLALGAREKHYDNNRATTAARDLDQGDVGVTFLYRVAPLTSLLLQATDADIDYKTATLDSTERRYLAGVTWEATAKTSGTVKVGRQKKDFDDTARTDFSGGSWAAAVVWSPLTYSFFVPVFFINIGLRADVRQITHMAGMTIFILVVAVLGKVIGCGALAWISGFNYREALRVGVGMISRGEVGLIIAGYGLASGIIGPDVFSVMILMVLITTMITPVWLRHVFPRVVEEKGAPVFESVASLKGPEDRDA